VTPHGTHEYYTWRGHRAHRRRLPPRAGACRHLGAYVMGVATSVPPFEVTEALYLPVTVLVGEELETYLCSVR